MRDAQTLSNREKSRKGREVKSEVAEILNVMLEKQLILQVRSKENFSHRDYGYPKQFMCDFVVETIDNKFILIRASNSYRSDRAKIWFYDFLGIQQFSKFAGEIVASILLVSDSEKENSEFTSARESVRNGDFFSTATHWLTFSELNEFFENYCSEVEDLFDENEQESAPENRVIELLNGYQRTFGTQLDQISEKTGSYYGRSGNNFEKYLVDELNEPNNLSAYKSRDKSCFEYDTILAAITADLGIECEHIQFLEATNTITKLRNGGSPKTDLVLKIYTYENACYQANISVKNTTATRVSCHDYQAKDFTRVIAPYDDQFKKVVETFQEGASWKDYDKLVTDQQLDINTDKILNQYMRKIIEWAVTGEHDTELLIDKSTQIANYMMTRNANTGACKIQSCAKYMEELYSSVGSSRGAPFTWTYPSKRRSQRIQLKMPISLPQD
jgi:hypothetical protein